MTTPVNLDSHFPPFIQPANDDLHDRTYRFGQPLTYLSSRQQVRLLIVRGRLNAAVAPKMSKAA